MQLKEYQILSTRTLNYKLSSDEQLKNCLLGMSGEVGEILDIFKKYYYQGHDINMNDVTEELGDLMFYIVNLATLLNLDMEKVILNNIYKLKKRFPNGFSTNESIRRIDHD